MEFLVILILLWFGTGYLSLIFIGRRATGDDDYLPSFGEWVVYLITSAVVQHTVQQELKDRKARRDYYKK